jgi:serine/threonine protein kinase
VRLFGFCADGTYRLLVYEYMSNGSLDRWLFRRPYDNNPLPFLDWRKRYKIIHDMARGLAFLHDKSKDRILHLDVKPQNILLDENFGAKLADFGLAKLMTGIRAAHLLVSGGLL